MTGETPFAARFGERVCILCSAFALLLALSVAMACDNKSLRARAAHLQAEGKYQESLKPLNRALKIDPDNAGALFLRGVAFNKLRKNEQAIQSLKRAGEDPRMRTEAGVLEAQRASSSGGSRLRWVEP